MINAVKRAQSFATAQFSHVAEASIPPRWTDLSCASSMFIQNRPARAQFIHDTSPFEFLTLKTATITVSCHKAKCAEDADAAITVATMEQVHSLMWQRMSAMALSAGDVDERVLWLGKRRKKKKSRKLPPLSHVALNLPHGDKFNMLTDR